MAVLSALDQYSWTPRASPILLAFKRGACNSRLSWTVNIYNAWHTPYVPYSFGAPKSSLHHKEYKNLKYRVLYYQSHQQVSRTNMRTKGRRTYSEEPKERYSRGVCVGAGVYVCRHEGETIRALRLKGWRGGLYVVLTKSHTRWRKIKVRMNRSTHSTV